MPISWALSTCVLFTLLMQLVNGLQFLNITCLLVSFTGTAAAVVFRTAIVALTCMYASL